MRTKTIFAALFAVASWSSTPFLLRLVSKQDALTTYTMSALLAFLLSSVMVLIFKRRTAVALLRDRTFVLSSLASGVFLAVWYCCFYESLRGPSVALSSGVAFTWPVISFLAMRYYRTGRVEASLREVSLLLGSLCGVILVTSGSHETGHSEIGVVPSLIFAVLASIGSGVYLPFGVRALARCHEMREGVTDVEATFMAVWLSNFFSLVSVSLFTAPRILLTDVATVRFDALSLVGYLSVGVGVYIAAEVAWTYCNSQHVSASISMLPFLVPAISSLVSFIAIGQPLSIVQAAGLACIIAANVLISRLRSAL